MKEDCNYLINNMDKEKETESFYSKENISYIKKSVDELRAGEGIVHELIEVSDE